MLEYIVYTYIIVYNIAIVTRFIYSVWETSGLQSNITVQYLNCKTSLSILFWTQLPINYINVYRLGEIRRLPFLSFLSAAFKVTCQLQNSINNYILRLPSILSFTLNSIFRLTANAEIFILSI